MIKAITKDSLISDKLFTGSSVKINYLWENLITEKQFSTNWVSSLYQKSIFYDLWLLLSSPMS